ncbi:MAG TPA: DUF2889 domain-containing protein [Acidimicrobiales bacterium]|nr:DUF2889 domain-containing protein [Acidimicrobiales bacterium]
MEPSASGKLRGGVQVTGPPLVAGPHAPATSTPPRSPGSVRRTTSIDTVRPDGPHGALVVDARGRDLRTGHDDAARAEVLGEVALTLRLEPATHTLVDVRADGSDGHAADAPDLRPLVGARVGAGFRRLLDEAMPEERDRGSIVHLLLDDLVGAVLVSGYALLHADALAPQAGLVDATVARLGDQCAGWALVGGFIANLRDTGRIATPHGPPAPALASLDDDAQAWHAMAPLPPHATRRRRRLDVLAPGPRGQHVIDVHFRDSHVDRDGSETVVHEYAAGGSVDARRRLIVDLRARALVPPWAECPAAVASAGRLQGTTFDDLRLRVRRQLVGTASCTHLNDTLRWLADLGGLLPRPGGSPREHGRAPPA